MPSFEDPDDSSIYSIGGSTWTTLQTFKTYFYRAFHVYV